MKLKEAFAALSPVRAFFATLILTVPLLAQAPPVVYVDINAAPGGNGTTWALAYNDLAVAMAAVASAVPALPPVQFWVTEGTYYPGTTQSSSFTPRSGDWVYGAFLAGATSVATRGGLPANTILSGDIALTPTNVNDDVYHVVTIPVGTYGTIVDGFKITHGNATLNGTNGGGVAAVGSSLSITVPAFDMANCIITENLATAGGGLAMEYVGISSILDCTIKDNVATKKGGGAYLSNAASGANCMDGVRFINTRFRDNLADEGGGLWTERNDHPLWFINCIWNDNAAVLGAGCYVGTPVATNQYPIRMVNCTFAHNNAFDAGTGGYGGALYYAHPGQVLSVGNSIMWLNTADLGAVRRISSIEWATASTALTVAYSDLQENPAAPYAGAIPWPGTGNIHASPMFVNPNNRNYKLTVNSPCVDAADDFAVPHDFADMDGDTDLLEQTPFDFTGRAPREMLPSVSTLTGVDDNGTNSFTLCGSSGATPVDTGIVDMGAYERP